LNSEKNTRKQIIDNRLMQDGGNDLFWKDEPTVAEALKSASTKIKKSK
jgi:hypothetical protein